VLGAAAAPYKKQHEFTQRDEIVETGTKRRLNAHLGVRSARTWSGLRRRDAMAWPTSFHSEGELCAKQRLETRIPARSGLGMVAPSPATTRASSTARTSSGSPRASDALTAAITLPSRSPGGPAGTSPAASAAAAVATVVSDDLAEG
jgi:hypothetical protein